MVLPLDTKIKYLSGVGPKTSEKLGRLGIETIEDVLFYYPRGYEDYTAITKIGNIDNGVINNQFPVSKQLPNTKFLPCRQAGQPPNTITIQGTIVGIANKKTRRRGFTVTEALVADSTGTIKVVWFNQPFLQKMLK
ncbi:MAG TPA: hypothetical protein PK263_01285, partial [bacterium]|nr:hypothetical protein [bacterium]